MSADQVILEQSLSDESGTPASFVDKQYIYVTDQNNGSYTGAITIDSTSVSNSGAFLSWSESFLVIPVVLQMYSTDLDTKKVDFGMALKAGYWNLIHSLSVDFNNKSVVQQTPFLNVFTSFKCLTSWSDSDVRNWGKVTGFKPDTSDAWLFNDAAVAAANGLGGSGVGLCNNRLVKTVPYGGSLSDSTFALAAIVQGTIVNTEVTGLSDSSLSCANEGLLCRMKWLNFDLEVSTPGLAAGSNSANKVALLGGNANGLNSIFKAYVQTSADNRAITFPAIVRMKDLCDFFDKAPLMKGGTVRLQINTNQCFMSLNMTGAQVSAAGTVGAFPSLVLNSTPIILGGGGTNPVMVSSADIGQGLQNIVVPIVGAPAAASTVLVACSIVRSQFTANMPAATVYTAPISSVRLYCPAYTMSPQEEAKYLSAQSTKKIVYEDIFQYNFNGRAAQSDFQELVTNGLPNLKSLLVMSFLPSASNGTASLASSLLSPFCGSGGCPDPIGITNFQVQLSGKNLFNDQKQYDYQEFVEQLVSSNQLNGSQVTGSGSGLIGSEDFSNLYRYYYADCSRGLPSDSGVSRSIQISGRNTSTKAVNLMVFATFQRSIVLDLRSGAVIA